MKILVSIAVLAASFGAYAVDPTANLPENIKKRHAQISDNGCEKDLPYGAEIYELGQDVRLYLVPCYMGAYQGSSYAYTADKYGNVSPVMVLGFDETINAVTSYLDLTNAYYNADESTLSTFAKGRGIGDCGQSSISKLIVDGGYVSVKTTEVRHKGECDGAHDEWPIVFSQK